MKKENAKRIQKKNSKKSKINSNNRIQKTAQICENPGCFFTSWYACEKVIRTKGID